MKWIKCDEKILPEKGRFLVVDRDKEISVVEFKDGGYVRGSWNGSCEYGCGGNDYVDYITHWMPLPDIPKDQ